MTGLAKRNPLARTMTFFCVLFAMIFALCMGTMSFFVYEQDMLNRYHAYTEDLLNYVARSIDGDDLLECMKTGVKSEKYNALQKLTNDLKETHNVQFLYIIQPISENPPDNMMDVLAAYTQAGKEDGTDGLTDLGNYTGDLYPPEVARLYLNRMDHDPKVTFFPNNTDFGNIYTAIRPIFDSKGEPIAVLCADVLIDEIDAGRHRYIEMSILVALVAGAILSLIMSHWLRNRVANPIQRISKSAANFADKCHDSKDLDVISFDDPDIHTNDEIEDLANALSSMCDDMKSYTEELILADREMGTLKKKIEKMDYMAYTDNLTGAGNKAAYEKQVTHLDWDILAGDVKFAIVMVDLNYLKRINDNFGHDHGNLYIKNLYSVLRQVFQEDKIFRIGGDEFVVILRGHRVEKAHALVSNVRQTMVEFMKDSNLDPWDRVSAAVGLCVYDPELHHETNDVFKDADSDMYREKKKMHAGRE